MKQFCTFAIAAISFSALSSALAADGDAARGERVFRLCAPCHSLQPDKNMTGPSLAGLWDRQVGTLSSFDRYSDALKSSRIIWGDAALDAWITEPQKFIPENHMTFRGIKEARQRADLIVYLKEATRPGAVVAQRGGMMGGGQAPNLKKLDPDDRVVAITHCRDTYSVTTADGQTRKFWERNLRLKTDVSDDGPEKSRPALVGAGMMGDRADVIFAGPAEISPFISAVCE